MAREVGTAGRVLRAPRDRRLLDAARWHCAVRRECQQRVRVALRARSLYGFKRPTGAGVVTKSEKQVLV